MNFLICFFNEFKTVAIVDMRSIDKKYLKA